MNRNLPLIGLLAGVMVLAALVEAMWRARYHVASPGGGLLFVLAAAAVGHAVFAASQRSRAPRGGIAESFAAGIAVLAVVYGLLSHFGHSSWFSPVVWGGVLVSLAATRPTRWLRRRVGLAPTMAGVVLFALVVRTAYFTDRLDLTTVHPKGFAWIDTPLWLSIAYGVERGCPPPDLLYSGGTLNYHFGEGLVIAAVRAMTGLSMQGAYFATMVSSSLALAALLAGHARQLLRAPRNASIAAALVGVALLQYITFNFPSVLAIPIFLWMLLELRRITRWSQVPLIAIGLLFLMVAKEVEYVLFVVLGLWIAGVRLWRERRWLPLVAVVLAVAVTRPFYDRLIRIDQKALLRPFVERLDGDWIIGELAHQSPWLLLGAFAVCLSFSARKRGARYFHVLGGACFAYLACMVLSAFVKPTFAPPMDPFSYGWIVKDMAQFELHGRLFLMTALVACVLAFTLRPPFPRSTRRAVAVASIAGLIVYDLLNFWKCPPQSLASVRPEDRGDDPVVPLLAQIEPAGTILAADRINWNDENPHWAAFHGHQFYLLRKGRWATAYRDYAVRVESQRVLFSTDDALVARGIVARAGITHVIESRERPVPWLRGVRPELENEAYRVYDVRSGR